MGKLKRTLCVCLMLAALLCGIAFQAFATQVAQPVACNTATGEQYTVLTAAAMEAAAGQTVALLTDVTEDAWIPVPEGVTLDLNGKILTAPYLSSYGNVIDSSEANSGLLCVPAERVYIRRDNAQLPVGTAEGYRFIQNNRFNEIILADGRYAFDFRAEEAAHSLLLADTETSGVTVRVEVSWTESDGIRYQFFDYNENFLREFIGSYDAATGRYGRMFTLTLFGTEGLKNLTLRAQLVSALGVTASSAGLQMETPLPPAADVTTDANGQVTEDVTVSNSTATATVATGTQLEQGTTSVTLTTTELTEGDKNITIADGEQSRSVDVHVEGVAATNTVPVIVTMEAFAPKYMNEGNLKLYHVENGTPVEMTRVASVEEVDAHNEYYYDVITGDVVMALATFSEITVVNVPANPWNGAVDHSWYKADATQLYIANGDQLWSFSQIVGGMAQGIAQDSFAGKTVKLLANIDLNDAEKANIENKIFYPIGYYNDEGTYEKSGKSINSGFKNFEGTFDGNGNTISNFYQNTWEMKGDNGYYDRTLQYYRDGMGLFGEVYGGTVKNLTIDNFSSDGEYTITGAVAALADYGATFENITIFNCNPRVYNTGNGGIVGDVGWYTASETENKVIFRNITVDNSNKISALWGSWDVPCGGIVGYYDHASTYGIKNAGILFENCHVAAQIDVNNDVCANYQYYQYRYAGMLIGTVGEVKTVDGKTVPNTDGIEAVGCTVSYGDWQNYWYCELVANSPASYTHDFQFGRLTRIEDLSVIFDDNSDTWKTTGNFVIVTTAEDGKQTAECYHIMKDENDKLYRHTHADAGWQVPAEGGDNNGNVVADGTDFNKDGVTDKGDWKEDRFLYLMPFNQLISGNSGYATYKLESFPGVTDSTTKESVKKFVHNFADDNSKGYYKNDEPVRLGELFKLAEGIQESNIYTANVSVFVSPVNAEENKNYSYKFEGDINHWYLGTLTIKDAVGPVKVTITDYYYCENTEIVLQPMTEELYMYRQMTDLEAIRADSQRTDPWKYAIVAEKDGIHYALGENGTATQVHVVDGYITDTAGVPGWMLGNDGIGITLKQETGEQYLSRNENSLILAADGDWTLSSVTTTVDGETVTTGFFNMNAPQLTEDEEPKAIAYNGSTFGLYEKDAANVTFDLRLYKYIDCLHKNTTPHNEQPADCYNVGYTAGEYCNDCGEWISGHEEIERLTHAWVTAESGTEYCSKCNAKKSVINGKVVELLPWNDANSLPTEGNWYLNVDVTVSKNANVGAEGLTLDLNGHTVTRKFTANSTTSRVYTLSQNSEVELVITDTVGNGTIVLDIAADAMDKYKALPDAAKRGTLLSTVSGKLVLAGGIIDGREAVTTGFAQATVFVDSFEALDMTGGVIIGGNNEGKDGDTGNGSAVYICRNATANITGGIIVGGRAYCGAAIYAGGNVTVGGSTVVIAGQAYGTISSSVINATMGDSIYAGAYTKQTTNIIGSNLTIEGNATINGGIAVANGLSFKVTGRPNIDKDMSTAEWNDYLTAYNKDKSTYGIVMPQRWTDENKGMHLDITGLEKKIPVTAFIDFTTAFDTEAAAETAAELIKNERDGGWRIYVNSTADDKYVLSLGIVRCANGHHCNDGTEPGTTCDECGEQVVRWTHWDYVSQLPSASGNYVLAADVTINHPQYPTTSPYIVRGGQTVRLDLNGKNIVRKVPLLTVGSDHYGNHRVVTVDKGAALTITDLSGKAIDEQGKVYVEYPNGTYDRTAYGGLVGVATGSETELGGRFTLCGGVLDGRTVYCDGYINHNNANDGTVSLYNYATFTMYGGKIIGMNQPWSGVGLKEDKTEATFNTNGSALGIFGNSEATVKGGEIVGGSAYNGGAIANAGKLTITGGTITGGKAQYGGAIFCTSTSSSSGELTITGGTITGGTIDGVSEGLYKRGTNIYTATDCRVVINIGGNAKIGGGVTVNGADSVTLSGTPTIDNNDTTASYGLYLMKLDSVKLDVAGLQPGAKIVIDNTGIFTKPIENKATAEAIRGCFTSTEPVYVIAQAANEYVLSVGTADSICAFGETDCTHAERYTNAYYELLSPTCVHGKTKGNCTEGCTEYLVWQEWTSQTTLPATTGNYRLTQAVTVSAQTDIAPGNKVVLDLNGQTVTRSVAVAESGQEKQRVYLLEKGSADNYAELVITDTATDGKICVTYDSGDSHTSKDYGAMIHVQNHNRLTVYGGIIDGTNVISATGKTATNGIIQAGDSASVTINGGTLMGMQNRSTSDTSGGSVIGGWGNSNITVNGGTLQAWVNGDEVAAYKGGAIATTGTLTVNGGTITGGKVTNGGTIYCSGTLTITGGTITGGTAGTNGGNIYATGTLNISGDAQITDGTATDGGGGNIYATGTLTITGGTITGGKAKTYGVNVAHVSSANGIVVEISGTAKICGGVTVVNRADDDAYITTLKLGGTIQIDGQQVTPTVDYDLRLGGVEVTVLNGGDIVTVAKYSGGSTVIYSLEKDVNGNVTGLQLISEPTNS